LGDFNDLMLCGTLCGVEMGLEKFGVPLRKGGVRAAMDYLNLGDSLRIRSGGQQLTSASESGVSAKGPELAER
jgi:hypothetical protein